MREPQIIEPPRWARSLIGAQGAAGGEWRAGPQGCEVRVAAGDRVALVSLRVGHARWLAEREFRDATARLYDVLHSEAARLGEFRPARIWNVIPGILEPLGSSPHRYMAFNAGRYDVLGDRPGAGWRAQLPTASGVGWGGGELVVHALMTIYPATAVENPRQVSAWRYSPRYGPRPPCFARATRVEWAPVPWLLMGGTASVVGEASRHSCNPRAQFREIVSNLNALVAAAGAQAAALEHLRVYYVRDVDLDFLAEAVRKEFGEAVETEFLRADLCRPELLVEVEGAYAYPEVGA